MFIPPSRPWNDAEARAISVFIPRHVALIYLWIYCEGLEGGEEAERDERREVGGSSGREGWTQRKDGGARGRIETQDGMDREGKRDRGKRYGWRRIGKTTTMDGRVFSRRWKRQTEGKMKECEEQDEKGRGGWRSVY